MFLTQIISKIAMWKLQICYFLCHLHVNRIFSSAPRVSFACHSYVLVCHSHVLVCYSCVTHMYLYISRMSLLRTCMSSVCHSYVLVCHPYVTRMYSYVKPYVTRIYSYVIRISLVCTCMSSVCHSYVLVSHPYVTHLYSYVIRMSLVCGFTMNRDGLWTEENKVQHDQWSVDWRKWDETWTIKVRK